MNERKALATIETDEGNMTIFYNGRWQALTAERGDIVETLDFVPRSLDDAAYAVDMMYSSGPWFLEWLE